jgi:hypothetical protein
MMCNWQDITRSYGMGKIQINVQVIRDACDIIQQRAQSRQTITYADLMVQLKHRGHRKINRRTIGHIVGEVSTQVAQVTNPSIYPSAIVVRKDTNKPGEGFWGLDMGTHPPKKVPTNQRAPTLQQYQNEVFNRPWSCNC